MMRGDRVSPRPFLLQGLLGCVFPAFLGLRAPAQATALGKPGTSAEGWIQGSVQMRATGGLQ